VIDIVNMTLAVPLVLGLVFGAALLSRETEASTHVLAWTQSVSRRRWVLTKTCAALSATVLCATATTAMVTWWSGTTNALNGNRFDPLMFDIQNLMPVAFAVFALGVGLAAGAWLRRALPAIGVAVGAFVAARVAIEVYLRPHYQHAVSIISAMGATGAVPNGSWVLGTDLVAPDGHVVTGAFDPTTVCPAAFDRQQAAACLNKLGYHLRTRFQPAGRYWHFQLTEAGLLLALGASLIAVATITSIRRDA
jgi:hypothetical protein